MCQFLYMKFSNQPFLRIWDFDKDEIACPNINFFSNFKLQNEIACRNTLVWELIYVGGVIRNDTGDLIMAFSVPTQCKSNNQAEEMAALYAIEWCDRPWYDKYDLELDSMMITDLMYSSDAGRDSRIYSEKKNRCRVVVKIFRCHTG